MKVFLDFSEIQLLYPVFSSIKDRKLERKGERTQDEGKQRGQGREANTYYIGTYSKVKL